MRRVSSVVEDLEIQSIEVSILLSLYLSIYQMRRVSSVAEDLEIQSIEVSIYIFIYLSTYLLPDALIPEGVTMNESPPCSSVLC